MTANDFRWQLRQLPREREPSRDLWPAIAAAIGAANPRIAAALHQAAPRESSSRWWRWTSAIAAALVLASIGLSLAKPGLLHFVVLSRSNSEHALVLKEADAIRNHYQAELAQFRDSPVPEDFVDTLRELDASAANIRNALDSRPDAVFLLGQLRHTYARRLELTQRLAML